MSRRVVILDQVGWMGHHPMYNKVLSTFFLSQGKEVVQIVSEPLKLLEELNNDCIDVSSLSIHGFNLSMHQRVLYRFFKAFYNDSVFMTWLFAFFLLKNAEVKRDDLIFLVSGDAFLSKPSNRIINRMLPKKWIALLMFLKENEINHLALKANKIFHLNEFTVNSSPLSNIYKFPDFTLTNNKSVKDNFKNDNLKIGLFGGLSKRKGILELMDLTREFQQYNFLIVGRIIYDTFNRDEIFKINSFIKNPPVNVQIVLNVKDDELFNGYFMNLDVVLCTYKNFDHSSNILTKAAYFNIPVIALRGTYLGSMVKDYNIGVLIDDLSNKQFSQALSEIHSFDIGRSNAALYYERNSIEKLNEVLS